MDVRRCLGRPCFTPAHKWPWGLKPVVVLLATAHPSHRAHLPCSGLNSNWPLFLVIENFPVPPTFFQFPLLPAPSVATHSSLSTSPSLSLRAQLPLATVFPSGVVRNFPMHSPDTR